MANLLSAINSSPIASALSGTQRMSVGGGARIPRFGPSFAAAGTKSKAPGLTPRVSPTVQDMLSRPKRTRRSGYSKTAPSASPLGKPPKAGAM